MSHEPWLWYRARTPAMLGTAVQDIRQNAHLNQDELAERTGSSRPTISRLERGRPVALPTLIDALTACGYEMVLIPRGTRVHLER
ncbi:helix-turn-helix transcriptional regulator [Cellulomonas bogoriensis]|uniref:HTH cro/C1-type domain-containing protein n=1 Tax=Cellulomonas bogoriensis 69B4 = DSM 16987 TaxID=1386082 RepID=A0A0A0BZX8_9CELL|nr:helix-turn-helix transcriptional regulator [Cellulomonas bogoriensis]KGM13501.1 hypothetical protein N869_13520 [Cellulomonas bogoriensis 69B4 = DSM 16987]